MPQRSYNDTSALKKSHDIVFSSFLDCDFLGVFGYPFSWCGPCQMIAPIFEEMSNTFEDVVFMKVDVDDNAETAATYNVSAMPTFILIKGGVVVERVMGADPNKLMASINAHM
mmetsp:Transcript_22153/g.46622  ORF Transcript_22153/g.46622 Transcript_22153/m.46622 type:complete len:113 (+) Transcript_22153:1154-1492(+)